MQCIVISLGGRELEWDIMVWIKKCNLLNRSGWDNNENFFIIENISCIGLYCPQLP